MIAFVQSSLVSVFMMLDASSQYAEREVERLEACISKLDTSPADAYEDGLAWMAETNRARARHCVALALIELGHLEEGAIRLEDLANATDGGTIQDRAVYLAQSGNAWLIAHRYEAAELTLSNAIRLSPSDPELYKDRARARVMLKQWLGVDSDATEALALDQNDLDALKMRIKARLGLNELDLAEKDLKVAMYLAPKDIDVLVLRGEVRDALRKSGNTHR
ncbi:tetratricopeptide repeat protein [Hirschia baltica]|uniref:Tetratricopeptide domain-containing protein n=1 Tax=Hirschia baltica (strain ATCC 49814 / DSM 5838 / IFAM 1418) TaxID=582402 RepID=C6XKH0_HIRBI|nr:tetratricopeptide domain-containing protein [Hirschia baltica]ACT57768.1 tetratricopeptide domain-containing protein [Hirschia baltica ATCC 49814]